MGHADQQDDLRIDETDEAEADRLAQDAERLDDQIETLTRGTTPPSERTFDEQWAGQLRTSASPLDLAEAEQAMLWSDDPVLRSLARGTGVRVTLKGASSRIPQSSGAEEINRRGIVHGLRRSW
jgi:hypothetical protein